MTKTSEQRSFRSDTSSLSAAEALVKDWPELSPAKAKRIAALLRSGRQMNA